MKTIALLPLKAHSARVPGKNFKAIVGKPLYLWILETLLEMPEIDTVLINTDSEELLADEGLRSQRKVILKTRPVELRGDEVSMNLVLADDIRTHAADLYLMTHATNPLLNATTIRRALELFRSSPSYDSLFSVNRYQTRFYRESGEPINHDPQNLIPTQDLEPWFEENSLLYLFTRESFATTDARIGRRPFLFPTPKAESIDIDDQGDWALAEAALKHKEFTK